MGHRWTALRLVARLDIGLLRCDENCELVNRAQERAAQQLLRSSLHVLLLFVVFFYSRFPVCVGGGVHTPSHLLSTVAI